MKILLAESMSYFELGGAAKACRGLVEALAQRGHSCAVVSIEDPAEMEAHGLKISGSKGMIESELNGIKFFAAESAQEQWRPMLHCLRTFNPDWTLISEQGALLLTLAIEEHDAAGVVVLAQSIITALPTESSVYIDQIRSLIKRTAGIITVSNYMREYIRQWSGLDSTILPFPAYGSGPFTHFHNFDSGYVTMINPCSYKGSSIFVSLARSLPHVEFAAVPLWGTDSKVRAELDQVPNVKMLEPSPYLDDIFKHAKVLLVPSLWPEAYGQVVIDAMLRGIPVLASNAGGLPEAKLGVDYVLPVNLIERKERVSKDEIRAIVPDQDLTPWLDTLNRVVTDRALYERLSLDSREAALSYVGGIGAVSFEQYLDGLAAAKQRSDAASA